MSILHSTRLFCSGLCFFFHLCNKQMSEQIKQQRCTYLLYLRAGLTVQFNHDVDFLELHPVMV